MRKAHYWKKAGKTAAPGEMVVFDCETWHGERARVQAGELQTFRLAVATAFRLERGKLTRERWVETTDPTAIRNLIVSRLKPDRPVYVWGHNLPYDIGAARMWGFLMDERYTIEKCALSATMTWVKGQFDGCGLVYIDTLNYLKTSLAKIGQVLGFPKMKMPGQDEPDEAWFAYCRRDVEVTVRAICSIIQFCKEQELGPWQPTATGMSFSAFRHRWMEQKVLVHTNRSALTIERSSYYGGIVDTAFVGKTKGPLVYELDVCSMYPSVCRNTLPTRLSGVSERVGLSGLSRLMASYMCVADVTLSAHSEVYPCRHKGKVFFPHGTYRTCLADPELRLALERGHIRTIHAVAWYYHAPIFKQYMEDMVALKTAYKEAGNEPYSLFCKLMANGLYGKTGQRTPRWLEWGKDGLQQIEELHGLKCGALERLYDNPPPLYQNEESYGIPELGLTLELRDYWGYVEVRAGEGESRDSCPAIAACVTSYARCLLRSYQVIAGAGHWYYSDTDSIWTDDVGLERLFKAGHVQYDTLGCLELKRSYDWIHVHGPKDYETPEGVKLKGIKKSATKLGENWYYQQQFPSAMYQISHPQPEGVLVRPVLKRLKRTIDRVVVGPDGWTRPYVFPRELPD